MSVKPFARIDFVVDDAGRRVLLTCYWVVVGGGLHFHRDARTSNSPPPTLLISSRKNIAYVWRMLLHNMFLIIVAKDYDVLYHIGVGFIFGRNFVRNDPIFNRVLKLVTSISLPPMRMRSQCAHSSLSFLPPHHHHHSNS
jgi:hypothetical protein